MSINLLPDKDNGRSAQEMILTIVGGSIIIIALLIGGATGWIWVDRSTLQETIASKTSEKEKLTNDIIKTTESQKELAYILDRQEGHKILEASDKHFDQILDRIAQSTPQRLRISTLSLKSTGEITTNGTAGSRDDVAAFTESLALAPQFTEVTVNQTDTQTDGVHFTVTLKIKSAAASPSPKPGVKP